MEKLVYLLWKKTSAEAASGELFRDQLLTELPESIREAGGSRIKISVTDQAVADGAALHLGPLAPDALVSFWLECVHDRAACERKINGVAARIAGYLVAESQPLRTEAARDEIGQRMPGFSLVGCIEPADHVSHSEFIERWETVHRDVAIATQSTFSYVRNEVVRPLTRDAPNWAGIVEEGFPIEALSDRRVFYDAADSEERFRENLKKMVESCVSFLSLERVDSHPMSEYRFF